MKFEKIKRTGEDDDYECPYKQTNFDGKVINMTSVLEKDCPYFKGYVEYPEDVYTIKCSYLFNNQNRNGANK